MSDTPVFDELTERITRIQSLLADPQPGLVTWKIAVYEQVNDLLDWWNEQEEGITR